MSYYSSYDLSGPTITTSTTSGTSYYYGGQYYCPGDTMTIRVPVRVVYEKPKPICPLVHTPCRKKGCTFWKNKSCAYIER